MMRERPLRLGDRELTVKRVSTLNQAPDPAGFSKVLRVELALKPNWPASIANAPGTILTFKLVKYFSKFGEVERVAPLERAENFNMKNNVAFVVFRDYDSLDKFCTTTDAVFHVDTYFEVRTQPSSLDELNNYVASLQTTNTPVIAVSGATANNGVAAATATVKETLLTRTKSTRRIN
jgi:hypothetical protein